MKRLHDQDEIKSTCGRKRRKLDTSENDSTEVIEIDASEVIEISSNGGSIIEKRELSPADSGFKEASITSSSHHLQRASNRIKDLQNEEDNFTYTEKLLRHILKRQNMIAPLENLNSTMDKYNPKVKAYKYTKYQVTKVINFESIVPIIPDLPSAVHFHGVILHSWRNYDGDHKHYFVRWLPMGILDDEWIIADYARAIQLKKTVKLAEMSMRQRRIVCERILK